MQLDEKLDYYKKLRDLGKSNKQNELREHLLTYISSSNSE